jgi:hypothetical protein
MANTITFTSAPFIKQTSLTNAGGTAHVSVLAQDVASDRRITAMALWTDDTVAKDLALHLKEESSGNIYEIATYAMVVSGGNTNSAVPLDLLAHTQAAPYFKLRDASGSIYFNLPKGWSIWLAFNTAVASGKTATLTIMGETYA